MFKQFVYESLSDYLKPKSEEEIRKTLGNLTPEEKLIKGAEHGILWAVKEALDEGADPSADDNYAIRWASEKGHLEIVKLLLSDKRVDPSANNNYAIRWASRTGHLELVKLLLSDKRVDPSADNNLAIRWASRNGHLEVVKLLLSDKRVDPSADDNYAIQLASENGHLEVVKLLLSDKRVDPSADDNYAIRLASNNGHLEVVKLLLSDKRVDPSADNNYAIQWASYNGHLEVVKLLLSDKRVDASANNNYAIRWASANGYLEIVKLLLSDKRVRDSLDRINLKKYQRQISTLKEGFSDYLKPKSEEEIRLQLNKLSPQKKLEVGLRNQSIEIIKEALDEGADPTQLTDTPAWGVRAIEPILFAAFNGHLETIKFLIENQIKYNYKYSLRQLAHAMLWANEDGHKDVQDYLRNYINSNGGYALEGIDKFNESFSNYLKPKSKEEIDSISKNLSTPNKFIQGIENDIVSLVEQALEEGIKDTTDNWYEFGIRKSFMYDSHNVFKFFFSMTNELKKLAFEDIETYIRHKILIETNKI